MKRIAWASGVLAAAWLGVATATAAEAKLGTVDMEKLFQGYYKTLRFDAQIKKQRDLFKQHATDRAEEIDALKKERDQQQERALNIALTDEARAVARKGYEDRDALYREKQKELKDFLDKQDKELTRQYMELRAEIVKELMAFVKTFGEREGFTMIVDQSGLTRNYIPVLVYADPSLDLSAAVLTELNRGHEEEAVAKPEGEGVLTPAAPDAAAPAAVPAAGDK